MSCVQSLTGLTDDCATNFVGGANRSIYIASRQGGFKMTVSAGEVSKIEDDNAADVAFTGYDFRKNSMSLTSTLQTGDVEYFQTEASGVISGLTKTAFEELKEILKDGVAVIVVDNNHNAWLLGGDNGADVTNLVASTGTAKTDANQIEVTFTAYEGHLPYRIADALAASLNIPL